MKQSKLFTKTRKEAPADEVSKNAQLLIKAGFISKEIAGVYSFLPLGLRVLKKIEQIIREEMNVLGGQEIAMTALQNPELWKKTDRWNDEKVDNWFKTKLKAGGELGLAFTHEEPLANIMKNYISSYRDLPKYVYQFQVKFRNELRAKSGIFRGREFLMKDLYSFNATSHDLDVFYEKAIEAYKRIFERLNIGDITFLTLASGGNFGVKFSHEFQTLTSVGEDTVYIHKGKNIAINQEVLNEETLKSLGVSKDELVEERAIEVGNIYKLGTFYSKPLDLSFNDESGRKNLVVMGSYGIGLTRLMGTIVEVLSDDKGIVWPKEVSPFSVHLIEINPKNNPAVKKETESVYNDLNGAGIEVLWDDREITAGEKFVDSDLIGIPVRLVISEKTLAENVVEFKERKNDKAEKISKEEMFGKIK